MRKALYTALSTLLFLCSINNVIANENDTFALDLANRQISITAGFNGANLLLFGAINKGHVILSIEGAKESFQVLKKNRIGGIWINNEERTLNDLPNFYVLASSTDAFEEISDQERHKWRLGYDTINTNIPIFDAHAREFYEEFVTLQERSDLYQHMPNSIDIAKSGLFRVNVDLPADIPPGIYTVRAFSVEGGQVLKSYQTALSINKVGFGARIYRAAHEYSLLYGIAAMVISVLSGLLANFIFNRRKA